MDGTENTADESTADNVNGDTVQPVDGIRTLLTNLKQKMTMMVLPWFG